LEELDDRHYLNELKKGNQVALEKIYAKYYSKVCATIHTHVKQRETTEDLAQELFVKFWNNRADDQIKSFLLQPSSLTEKVSLLF